MYTTPIETFAVNILKRTNVLPENTVFPEVDSCSLCGVDLYLPKEFLPFKEFTLVTCGHIYHQKCLKKHLVNGEAICPNKKCNKVIETFLSPDLFKGPQDKPSTADENTISKPMDSGNQTPVDDDVTLMHQLGLLGGEEQTSSKTTDQASSSIDQTRPVENTSSASNDPEILNETSSATEAPTLQNIPMDDVVNENTPQIQRPICEKCSEEITIDFQKDTVFLSCNHAVHLDCINNLRKRCPTCTSADDVGTIPVEQASNTTQKKRPNESGESTEKLFSKKAKNAGGKKVSGMLKKLIEELSSETSQNSEVTEEGNGGFFDLYNAIINMEGHEEIAKRDVIKSYFNFGEALDDCFNHYKEDNPKRTAQALVNKEVREQLPNVSDDALRKKKERALKIFELFNEIGEDKIQKIKSFSASAISKLGQDEIDKILLRFASVGR